MTRRSRPCLVPVIYPRTLQDEEYSDHPGQLAISTPESSRRAALHPREGAEGAHASTRAAHRPGGSRTRPEDLTENHPSRVQASKTVEEVAKRAGDTRRDYAAGEVFGSPFRHLCCRRWWTRTASRSRRPPRRRSIEIGVRASWTTRQCQQAKAKVDAQVRQLVEARAHKKNGKVKKSATAARKKTPTPLRRRCRHPNADR